MFAAFVVKVDRVMPLIIGYAFDYRLRRASGNACGHLHCTGGSVEDQTRDHMSDWSARTTLGDASATLGAGSRTIECASLKCSFMSCCIRQEKRARASTTAHRVADDKASRISCSSSSPLCEPAGASAAAQGGGGGGGDRERGPRGCGVAVLRISNDTILAQSCTWSP